MASICQQDGEGAAASKPGEISVKKAEIEMAWKVTVP